MNQDNAFVILHKGLPFKNKVFNSAEEARNYIVFTFPKRQWKKRAENEFVCALFGAIFNIIELTYNK
jgi:hypothetical protein